MFQVLFDPFMNFSYMRRAIVACCVLSMSITPVGGFLILKRMSLIGDALSHALLPGIAIGYVFAGISSYMIMSIGGFISGLIVAILSIYIADNTSLEKDACFSGFYLGSLALGIVLMSWNGCDVDLLNLLFGSISSISLHNIKYIGLISTITLICLALFYRALVTEAFDPDFLKNSCLVSSRYIQVLFLFIVVLNLIASVQVTGTLMSIGMMMLPSLSARLWVTSIVNMLLLSVCIALLCSWMGLVMAFHISLPSGPTIILCNTIVFFVSVLFGKNQGILVFWYKKH